MKWLQWFFMSLKRFVVLDTLLIKRFPFSQEFSRFFLSILSITIFQQIGNFHFYFPQPFLGFPFSSFHFNSFQFISNDLIWFENHRGKWCDLHLLSHSICQESLIFCRQKFSFCFSWKQLAFNMFYCCFCISIYIPTTFSL